MEVVGENILTISNLRTLAMSIPPNQIKGQLDNVLWKVPTSDKLSSMKLPARLLLAVLTLCVGAFSPIVPPQMSLARSQTSDCCATVSNDMCHRCPVPVNDSTSTSGSSCCGSQLVCCALYLTKATPFAAHLHFLGTMGVKDERATTRATRPPVPPPRGMFS
jgi:hypothetical protein